MRQKEGRKTEAGVRLPSAPRQARLVDMHEVPLLDAPAFGIDDDQATVPMAANTIANIRLTF
ncbi:hypothetical protein [Cohnella nanjingensis]|uniref:hypothetical protein n=1 Tax=Cohnella nanjingensis TaxID=1387779 RepID=UPI001FE79548|nr:hypothetical protein [Cohnella nanjingensis]